MNQREYEAIYIVPTALDDQQVGAILEKYKNVVHDQGGTVDKAEKWEKRRLAYPIKGHAEGIYCLMHFKSSPKVPSELSRLFRIDDSIVRSRIFLREE
jgi:small subunit ribosomal protein S6